MKVLFLSGCAPAKYNHGEPNAYPFYLIKEVAAKHETVVMYFNANEKIDIADINNQLLESGVKKSREIKSHRLFKKLFTLLYIPKALVLKLFIRFKIPAPSFIVPLQLYVYNKYPDSSFEKGLKEFKPDHVIVFPMQLYFAIKKITRLNIPVSVLCTDSTPLHFTRQLDVLSRTGESKHKTFQMLTQAKKLERAYKKIPADYFFVGERDKQSFMTNSGLRDNCFFIPHHLYSYVDTDKNRDSSDILNVAFAGGGHTIYTGDEADIISQQIANDKELLQEKVHFFFLGKGYDKAIDTLKQAGYSVDHREWVKDYDEFMSVMHMQVFPIILGTGTKAKVLAAMSSGLLCIGTWYSFENIQANNNEHYLMYKDPSEIPGLLRTISRNKETYEQIAGNGKLRILDLHDTSKIVRQILPPSQKA